MHHKKTPHELNTKGVRKAAVPLLIAGSLILTISLGRPSHASFMRSSDVISGYTHNQETAELSNSLGKAFLPVATEANTNSSHTNQDENAEDWLIGAFLIILPLCWRPSRKAIGLLFIILGSICTLTGVGAIAGIPLILIGGILFFI